MRVLLPALLALMSFPVLADEPDIGAIVESYVLPGYRTLADEAADLASTAAKECSPDSSNLIAAYHNAFDAWIDVSHLRFGPSERDDDAFALAFWPDPRGSTPKALASLIRGKDVAVSNPAEFATVSIAARGFYALEFLLFDPKLAQGGDQDYHCTLVQAIAADISLNAAAILERWLDGYGALMSDPGNDTYRTSNEAAQQLFTALSAGLQFTSDTRLGRPMGTFERPPPRSSGSSSIRAVTQACDLVTDGDQAIGGTHRYER